jgi:NDP-sugar pyrophosphorylase family protein
MNIVIPMAGRGQRFKDVGYNVSKPLIEFLGKTMIEHAVDSLGIEGKYIFCVLKEDEEVYKLATFLRSKYTCEIVIIDEVTEGPACTVLLAEKYINNDEPLVITNCDQIMLWNGMYFSNLAQKSNLDGMVVTYYSDTPKNSYAKVDKETGLVTEMREKVVISNDSLNGIHYWRRGSDFVESANEMITADDRTNNEFYISNSYNYLIKNNKKIGIFKLYEGEHRPIGVPEDLSNFLKEIEHGNIQY